jgi:hypothetical protein
MQQALCAFLCLALAAFSFACTCAGLATLRLQKRLNATLTDISRMTQSITGVSADLRKISESYRKQADAQSMALTETAQEMKRTTLALNGNLISLNAVLVHLDQQVQEQGQSLTMLEQEASFTLWDAQEAIEHLNPALDASRQVMENAAQLTANPDIASTLSSLDASAAHLEVITGSAERDALALERRLNQLLKPASLAKRTLGWLLQVGPPIATAVK